jgi:drug/metabolite transporter (DMT)-like permease
MGHPPPKPGPREGEPAYYSRGGGTGKGRQLGRRGVALFVAMGVIWGIPYLLIKVADGGVSVPVLVWTRVTIGALILVPLALAQGAWRPEQRAVLRAHWTWLAAYSVIEIVGPWTLLSAAERELPSSTSGLLIASVPIIGAVLAWLIPASRRQRREGGGGERGGGERGGGGRVSAVRALGLAMGFAGVVLLAGHGAGRGDLGGDAEVLLTALGYAAGPMIANRKLAGVPGIAANAACLLFAAVVYAPAAALTWPHAMPSAQVLASLAALGAVCTAAGLVGYFWLIGEVGAARATVVTYVNPAVAVALGAGLLGERLTPAIGVSFVLILAGSVLATRVSLPAGERRRRHRRRSSESAGLS